MLRLAVRTLSYRIDSSNHYEVRVLSPFPFYGRKNGGSETSPPAAAVDGRAGIQTGFSPHRQAASGVSRARGEIDVSGVSGPACRCPGV